ISISTAPELVGTSLVGDSPPAQAEGLADGDSSHVDGGRGVSDAVDDAVREGRDTQGAADPAAAAHLRVEQELATGPARRVCVKGGHESRRALAVRAQAVLPAVLRVESRVPLGRAGELIVKAVPIRGRLQGRSQGRSTLVFGWQVALAAGVAHRR